MRLTTSLSTADRDAARARWRAVASVLRLPGFVVTAAWALAAAPAWADHPMNGASPPMSPLASALLFGGVTLVLGLVVIAIVRIIFSDESRES